MGMFDYVKVEMPLPKTITMPSAEWFQTKDVPTCQLYMAKWVIDSEGRLLKKGYRIEDKSDKSLPKGDVRRLAGSMSKVYDEELDEIIDFHGVIEFYELDNKTRDWWCYRAKFTDGICVSIELDEFLPSPPTEKE